MKAGRISRFLDGGIPGTRVSVVVAEVEDTSYVQPDLQVIEIADGEKPTTKKLCQRLQHQPVSISQWLRDNQNPLMIVGGLYVGYRLFRR